MTKLGENLVNYDANIFTYNGHGARDRGVIKFSDYGIAEMNINIERHIDHRLRVHLMEILLQIKLMHIRYF